MAKRLGHRGVGSELLPVALIVACLAATLGLVVAMHRKTVEERASTRPKSPPTVVILPPGATEDADAVPELAPPAEVVVQPPKPVPPAQDPTKPILARLSGRTEEQETAAREADRQAEAFESARQAAVAESERWRRRETVVRTQLDELDEKAQRLEKQADALALERDVLAKERDAAKAALVKARARSGGYAVMPHRSPNGTWQRPVILECKEGKAILQPRGLAFSMLDMSPYLDVRSPLALGVAAEIVRAQRAGSPDGGAVVPYIYFVVRPDGIRPFYEARACLERLGIAFGYELADKDWDIEFPDFDDLVAWDGPPDSRRRPAARASAASDFVWPVQRPGGIAGDAPGAGNDGGKGDNPFVWPRTPVGYARGGGDDPSEPGAGVIAGAARSLGRLANDRGVYSQPPSWECEAPAEQRSGLGRSLALPKLGF